VLDRPAGRFWRPETPIDKAQCSCPGFPSAPWRSDKRNFLKARKFTQAQIAFGPENKGAAPKRDELRPHSATSTTRIARD